MKTFSTNQEFMPKRLCFFSLEGGPEPSAPVKAEKKEEKDAENTAQREQVEQVEQREKAETAKESAEDLGEKAGDLLKEKDRQILTLPEKYPQDAFAIVMEYLKNPPLPEYAGKNPALDDRLKANRDQVLTDVKEVMSQKAE